MSTSLLHPSNTQAQIVTSKYIRNGHDVGKEPSDVKRNDT